MCLIESRSSTSKWQSQSNWSWNSCKPRHCKISWTREPVTTPPQCQSLTLCGKSKHTSNWRTCANLPTRAQMIIPFLSLIVQATHNNNNNTSGWTWHVLNILASIRVVVVLHTQLPPIEDVCRIVSILGSISILCPFSVAPKLWESLWSVCTSMVYSAYSLTTNIKGSTLLDIAQKEWWLT